MEVKYFRRRKGGGGGGAWGLNGMGHGMTIILSTESGVEVKDFRRGMG